MLLNNSLKIIIERLILGDSILIVTPSSCMSTRYIANQVFPVFLSRQDLGKFGFLARNGGFSLNSLASWRIEFLVKEKTGLKSQR